MNKKHQLHILPAFTALIITVAIIVCGCGSGGSAADEETAGSADTAVTEDIETTTAALKDTLPKGDFGGEDFNILLWDYSQIAAEEETGDVINDAVYRRNLEVEELYNVNMVFDVRKGSSESGQSAVWLNSLTSAILAGDDSIHLAGGYGYRLASHSLYGGFHNLNELSAIDFSEPWWSERIMESSMFGNQIFMAVGSADPQYYDCVYAMYFNKRFAEMYNIDDLYGLVRGGKWTLDKLIEYSALASADLNGDNVMDDTDRYGYLTGWNMEIDAFIPACEIKITGKDKDGMPELLGLSERYVDAQKKLSDFTKQSGNVLYKDSWSLITPFMNGQGLFLAERIQVSHIMREMEDDFGILPYPKWNEQQDSYGTYLCIDNTTGFSIPITADGDKSGCILNALSALGYEIMRPEYYERVLKTKVARDEDSAEMLDIIFGSVTDDFSHFYSFCFGDQGSPWMLMRMSLRRDAEINSMWAKNETMYQSKMEELISILK